MFRILKTPVLLLLGGLFFSLQGLGQGVVFFEGTWEDALKEARKERKLVFVDAYTTWCPPCKAMNRNTFPKAEVGEYFSENFISYKFDMEKGEGPVFASKYGVAAYPTLLFINFKGEVVHTALGYKSPKELISEGMQALHPSKNKDNIVLEYESGNREPEILLQYAYFQKKSGEDYRDYADEYFATQEDKQLLDKKNWQAIRELSNSLQGPEFLYLVKKQKKFIKKYGARPVLEKIYDVLKKASLESGLTGNPAKYKQALSIAEKNLKDNGQSANRLKMTYTEARKNWEVYAERAIYHYDTYPISQPKELNHSALLFYKHIQDPGKLENALRWTRQSIAMENEAYNNETQAKIYYKLERYSEALRSAYKAIQLAQLNDKPTASLERLIDKIKGKQG